MTTFLNPDDVLDEKIGGPAERVARGAFWLDERVPGWPALIDLTELDLAHADCCIVGQTDAADLLEDDGWDDYDPRLGFDTAAGPGDLRDLDAAWRALIDERQGR